MLASWTPHTLHSQKLRCADWKYSNSSTVKPTLKAWAVWLSCMPCSETVTDIGSVCFVHFRCTLLWSMWLTVEINCTFWAAVIDWRVEIRCTCMWHLYCMLPFAFMKQYIRLDWEAWCLAVLFLCVHGNRYFVTIIHLLCLQNSAAQLYICLTDHWP